MRLTDKQEDLLAAVKRAKEVYDEEIALLELDLRRAKEKYKNPIRLAVEAARNGGVPVRQIHQKGLGMAQYNSMDNFLNPAQTPAEKMARMFEVVEPEKVERELPRAGVFRRKGERLYFIDESGDEDYIQFLPTKPHELVSEDDWDLIPADLRDRAAEEVRRDHPDLILPDHF